MEFQSRLVRLALEGMAPGEDNNTMFTPVNVAPRGAEHAFDGAMRQATLDLDTPPVRGVTATEHGGRHEGAHGVGTYGSEEKPAEGDAILGGFQSIRKMFDGQYQRASAIGRELSPSNASDLIVAQAEMTKLTLMVEVTSKLAGKLTQACDTLLKG